MDIEYKSEIPKELIKFVEKVSSDYNLSEWKLILWDIVGNNECILDMKLIYLDSTKNIVEIKKWFIHEVAHALLPNDLVNRKHEKAWSIKFKELLKKYNINKD